MKAFDEIRKTFAATHDAKLRNYDAGRFQSHLRAVGAIVALGGGMAVGIDVKRVVGTRLHTGLTANAAAGVEVDNAILALKKSFSWTNSDAGSVVAVVTTIDQEIAARVRKLALLNILDPRAIDANRHIMLRLAGHRTGMTPNTLSLVNHKRVLRHYVPLCFP